MIVDMRAERQDRSDMPNAEADMPDYAAQPPAGEAPAADPPPFGVWLDEGTALAGDEEPSPARWPLIAAILVSVLWAAAILFWGISASPVLSPTTMAPLGTLAIAGPMLIAVLWLVGQRSSRAEQRRFALTARDMREEAAALERAVGAIGQALSANRFELSAQAIALSEMAQAAETRFRTIARDLTDDIQMVEAHGRTLADIAMTSQSSMTQLLDALPRAAEEIGEASDRMAEAARSAHTHAMELDAQFVALGRRGQDADTIA
ncbi:MAG: hypothetical protein ACTMKV_05955, partial [Sphingomonas parapaucimobilis]